MDANVLSAECRLRAGVTGQLTIKRGIYTVGIPPSRGGSRCIERSRLLEARLSLAG